MLDSRALPAIMGVEDLSVLEDKIFGGGPRWSRPMIVGKREMRKGLHYF